MILLVSGILVREANKRQTEAEAAAQDANTRAVTARQGQTKAEEDLAQAEKEVRTPPVQRGGQLCTAVGSTVHVTTRPTTVWA